MLEKTPSLLFNLYSSSNHQEMKYFEIIGADDEEELWKRYGKTGEIARKDVEHLREWLKSQPHLPCALNDHHLRNFLVMNKANLDKAKPRIEMYFRMGTMFPDMFTNRSPFGSRMLEASKHVYHIPLPKLCSNWSRITIIKPKENNADIDIYAAYCHLLNLLDLRLLDDFFDGNTIIFDAEHCKMSYAMKLTPMFIKAVHYIYDKIITARTVAVHIINASPLLDQILSLIRGTIKPKLMDRIKVHRDVNSMYEEVPKDILPKDYGGNEKSLDELEELLYKRMEEYREFFEERDQWKVNESLRPLTSGEDDFFGCYGSFKKLEVD